LSLAVILGAAGMALAGRLEAVAFRRFEMDGLVSLAFTGASFEESMKLVVVVLFAVTARRTFNDPMDGLVYGSMAGLGAALDEGAAVLRLLPPGSYLLPPPEMVRLCGHLVMGGIGGFGVGCVYLRGRRGSHVLVLSFLAAVLLHFGWDFLALRVDRGFALEARDRLLGAALMLVGLLLYGRLVAVGERWSHDLFAPDPPPPGGRWP
jgi:RsiW-degrading membrane proteinase PrsW (M82 family)